MDRALSSRLKKLLLAVALLAGSYLVAANLFLNTPVGPWAVNRRPQRVRVTWAGAWSVLPGEVRVRGLRIEGHTGRADWWIAADRCRGWIDLPALAVKQLRVRGLTGEGVRSSTVLRSVETPPGPPRRGAPWRIEMPDVALAEVREIGWQRFRLAGSGTVRGGFSLRVGGDLTLAPTALRMPGSRLLLADETAARGIFREIVRDLDVRAELSIAPYTPRRHPGVAGFEFVTGTLDARGKTTAGTGATGNPGDLTINLRLDHGRMAPGSRASLRGPQVTALLAVEPAGAAPQLILRAEARETAFGRRAGRPPALSLDAVHLEAVTPETRFSRLLAKARELRRTGILTGGGLRATFNATGLRLAAAGPSFSWQLTADRGTGRIDLPALLHGEILLDGLRADGLSAQVERVHGPPPEPGRRAWAVRLTDARLAGIREIDWEDFRLDAPEGGLEAAGNLSLDPDGALALGALALTMEDGRLRRGAAILAHDLSLRTAADVSPYPFRTHAGMMAGLDVLSGTIAARGKLREIPLGLDGRKRTGDFALDLHLDHGRLVPGSRAVINAGKPLRITGNVQKVAAAGAQPPRLHLSAEAKGLTVPGAAGFPPLFEAATATLSTATPELRLRRLLSTAEELRGAGRLAPGTPLAADFRITGLRMNGTGTHILWRVVLDRASGRLDLAALRSRRIALSAVTGEGVTIRIDPNHGPVPPPGAPWPVRIADVRLSGPQAISLGEGRLTGTGQLAGGVTFDRGELAIERAALTVLSGRLESQGDLVGRGIAVRTDLRVAPFAVGHVFGAALLRFVSGSVAIQGQVSSLGFLERYLRKAPWLRLAGQGRLDADARLDQGRLLAGSRLTVADARVQAGFLDDLATGEATVAGAVDDGRATVRVDFDRFEIAGREGEPAAAYIRGQGLRLGLVSNDLDLATPVSDLHASVDLPDGEVPDLTAYNAYLPPGTGVSVLSGSGRLRLHFAMDAVTQTGNGEVMLSSGAVRALFQDIELNGNLLLRAKLASPDLKGPLFQLAGTRLDLDRVTYRELGAEPGPETPGWWAHLELVDGTMVWRRPLSLRSQAVLEMKNSGLLLSLFARRKNFPRWFQRLLSVEGIRAQGTLLLENGAIEIAPLRVTGGRLDLRSRLRFTRTSRQGDLFIRWGKLATGIELRDGKRSFKLRHPEAWFESGKEPD